MTPKLEFEGWYLVFNDKESPEYQCTCPEFRDSDGDCKHVHVIRMLLEHGWKKTEEFYSQRAIIPLRFLVR